MTDIEGTIQQVSEWLKAISLQNGLPDGFEIRGALAAEQLKLLGESRNPESVRWAALKSLDGVNKRGWGHKGIYVWFWRMGDLYSPWPLYVGKTEAVQGMRGRHLKDHISYAASGRDMLCDPVASRDARTLMCFDGEGVLSKHENPKARASGELIGKCMVKQFEVMSVLLLPMNAEALPMNAKALTFRQAEGVLIAAAELLHQEINGVDAGKLACMMNSPGKASALGKKLPEPCRLPEMATLSGQLRSLLERRMENA